MIKIIVVAHCDLAFELVDAILWLYLSVNNLIILLCSGQTITLDQMRLHTLNLLRDVSDKNGILVLVDMFGGTPCNASLISALAQI